MFSKTTSSQQPQQTPATPRAGLSTPALTDARRAKPASLLASDLVFEGNISGDGELMIDGVLKGDVHVARLIVGEHARVEGTVRGAQIEIRGEVNGNIEGKSVRLLETAHVEGDITHEQLSIDVGAFFQGRCAQFRQAAAPATPLPKHQPEATPAEVTA
jgi:cytoskeletal protein CcmA (bactofilin family)